MTSWLPARKPPQLASDLENVPIRRSTRSSTPSSSAAPAPRAPSTPAPCASSTMSRAPKRAHRSAICGSGAMSPSIEKTPSTTTRMPPPSCARPSRSVRSSLSIRLWRKARSFARLSRQPSRIEAWSPESATTVSPGASSVPSAARFAWCAGRGDERLLGAHPLGDLLLELEVQRDRAVEQARAGQPGAVLRQRVVRGLDDALVGGQAEVVVGAEHDPLGALHLDDGAGRALERAEVGQHVGLARGAQLLGALVAADLGEDVV